MGNYSQMNVCHYRFGSVIYCSSLKYCVQYNRMNVFTAMRTLLLIETVRHFGQWWFLHEEVDELTECTIYTAQYFRRVIWKDFCVKQTLLNAQKNNFYIKTKEPIPPITHWTKPQWHLSFGVRSISIFIKSKVGFLKFYMLQCYYSEIKYVLIVVCSQAVKYAYLPPGP